MSKQEFETVVLTLDDEIELECAILFRFDFEGREYIALLPQGDNEYARNGLVFLYRFLFPEGSDEPQLELIADDEEYERVSEAYDQILAEEEAGESDNFDFHVES